MAAKSTTINQQSLNQSNQTNQLMLLIGFEFDLLI